MSLDQRQLYLRLMATYDAHAVYPRLVRASKWTRKRRGGGGDGVDAVAGMDGDDLSFGPLDACLAICRRHGIADASAHLLEMRGDARGALDEVRRAPARARADALGARPLASRASAPRGPLTFERAQALRALDDALGRLLDALSLDATRASLLRSQASEPSVRQWSMVPMALIWRVCRL